MIDLFLVLGVVLVLEGGLYAVFPGVMKKLMAIMIQRPEDSLRLSGLSAATFGVGIIWVVKTFM